MLRLFGRRGFEGKSQQAPTEPEPAVHCPPLPIYLSGCVESRDAIRELVQKYTPKDGRFSPYGSEARALWTIRDKLVECATLRDDEGEYGRILKALRGGVARLQAARKNDMSANTDMDGDSPCCLYRAVVYQRSAICAAVKYFLCTEGVLERFPDAASHALIVLSYVLEFKATLYLLTWARPFGLSCLRDVFTDAIDNSEAWGITPGSFLGSNITSVIAYMQSNRFREDRALIKCLRSPPPQPVSKLKCYGSANSVTDAYLQPLGRRRRGSTGHSNFASGVVDDFSCDLEAGGVLSNASSLLDSSCELPIVLDSSAKSAEAAQGGGWFRALRGRKASPATAVSASSKKTSPSDTTSENGTGTLDSAMRQQEEQRGEEAGARAQQLANAAAARADAKLVATRDDELAASRTMSSDASFAAPLSAAESSREIPSTMQDVQAEMRRSSSAERHNSELGPEFEVEALDTHGVQQQAAAMVATHAASQHARRTGNAASSSDGVVAEEVQQTATEARRAHEAAMAAEQAREEEAAAEVQRQHEEAAEAQRQQDAAAEARRRQEAAADMQRRKEAAAEAQRQQEAAAEAQRQQEAAAKAEMREREAQAAAAKAEEQRAAASAARAAQQAARREEAEVKARAADEETRRRRAAALQQEAAGRSAAAEAAQEAQIVEREQELAQLLSDGSEQSACSPRAGWDESIASRAAEPRAQVVAEAPKKKWDVDVRYVRTPALRQPQPLHKSAPSPRSSGRHAFPEALFEEAQEMHPSCSPGCGSADDAVTSVSTSESGAAADAAPQSIIVDGHSDGNGFRGRAAPHERLRASFAASEHSFAQQQQQRRGFEESLLGGFPLAVVGPSPLWSAKPAH